MNPSTTQTLGIAPWLLFERHSTPQTERLVEQALQRRRRRQAAIFCAHCHHLITTPDEKISVGGAHTHTFTNPHGITYEIGCFRHASGCAQVGESTAQWTWFAGYRWQVAVCAGCQTHVGWSYRSAHDGFSGLILARLVARPEQEQA